MKYLLIRPATITEPTIAVSALTTEIFNRAYQVYNKVTGKSITESRHEFEHLYQWLAARVLDQQPGMVYDLTTCIIITVYTGPITNQVVPDTLQLPTTANFPEIKPTVQLADFHDSLAPIHKEHSDKRLSAYEDLEIQLPPDTKELRRIELIKKKNREGLTPAETAEFNQIQATFFEHLDAKHPRTPIDLSQLDQIEARLKSNDQTQ